MRVPWIGMVVGMLAATAAHADGRALAGTYVSELAGPALTLQLGANGLATMAGETARWQVRGDTLVLGEESFRFRLEGGRLLLTDQAGNTLAWKRAGAAGGAAAGAPAGKGPRGGVQAGAAGPARAPAGRGSPRDEQVRQFLMSSAWCSFSYNQHTGTSRQSRGVFHPDGTISLGSNAETYNSGQAGTVAGQHQGGGTWRWVVQNERLLVDTGEGQGLQDVNLQVKANSSGNPVMIAGGTEYVRCR